MEQMVIPTSNDIEEQGRPSAPVRILLLSYTFQPEPGAVRGLPLAKWLVK